MKTISPKQKKEQFKYTWWIGEQNFLSDTFFCCQQSFTKWSVNWFPSVISYVSLFTPGMRNKSFQNDMDNSKCVCHHQCVWACTWDRRTTPDPAALHVLLHCRWPFPSQLCRVISLLSATGLQVTHAHNEQWHHTSTGCRATSIALTECAERERRMIEILEKPADTVGSIILPNFLSETPQGIKSYMKEQSRN